MAFMKRSSTVRVPVSNMFLHRGDLFGSIRHQETTEDYASHELFLTPLQHLCFPLYKPQRSFHTHYAQPIFWLILTVSPVAYEGASIF